MIALALKWLVRIVFSVNLKSSFTVSSQRLINHKFPGIHQHHHQHAAGEDIVRRNLALVMRVPHKRPTALAGWVGLGVGRKQCGAIGAWGVGRAVRVSRTGRHRRPQARDRKSTRLNSSHGYISYAVFCLKKKNKLTTWSY